MFWASDFPVLRSWPTSKLTPWPSLMKLPNLKRIWKEVKTDYAKYLGDLYGQMGALQLVLVVIIMLLPHWCTRTANRNPLTGTPCKRMSTLSLFNVSAEFFTEP